MSLRYFANAPATTLSASCTNSDTTIQVASTAGLPIQYPYTLIIDRELSTEEAVSVTNAAGTTLTVTRGIDSTTAFAHSNGAEVVHGITAQDVREANTHVNSNSGVHGVTGDLVGKTDAQTLTNKDLSSGTNMFPSTLALDADLDAHTAATVAHGATGAVVGTTNTQTLTNKTVDLASNTLVGTKAQFNTALSDGDFASQAGTETLTNKTLTSPTLTDPVVTGVGQVQAPFKTADESVTSSTTLQNDDHLSFSVVAGAKYAFTGKLFLTYGTGSFKFALNGPALTAMKFSVNNQRVTAYGSANTVDSGSAAECGGYIECSADGTVNLQWAQNASDGASSTLQLGSFLQVRRVA